MSPIIEKILNADTLLIGSQNSLMNRQAIIGHWLKDLYTALFHMIKTIIIRERSMLEFFIVSFLQKNILKKNVLPYLKSTEDLFKMLNGEVKVYVSYKCLKSQRKTDSQIKEKMEEFDEDLKNAFEIGAELNKNR